MKYSGNLKENLIKMRQYFVNEFGFVYTWCSKNVVDELDEYFKGNK